MIDEVELGVVREDGLVEELIGLVVQLGLTQYPVGTLVLLGFERKGPNRFVKKVHHVSEDEKLALHTMADRLWGTLAMAEKIGMLCRVLSPKADEVDSGILDLFKDIEEWQDVLVR